MFFSPKLAAFAALSCASLAVIPVVRSAEIAVTVGGPGVLTFDPENISANVGDVVTFTFKQKNHTVTQSTLDNPCVPKEGGFDSGFVPVADDVQDGFPIAQLTIRDTNPLWVYCKQGNHCQQGMVMAINGADQFEQFKSTATGSANSTASSAAPSETPSQTASETQTATSSAASSASTSTDHKVIVGGSSLTFSPSNITANPGDTVTFEFHQKNHTVTESTFNNPCVPLAQIGFDSGFMPVADGAATFPTYTIQVNDSNPAWAFCAQGNHCGQGMVFSINANENSANTFSAFQEKARQINGTSTSTSGSSTSAAATGAAGDNGAIGMVGRGSGAGIAVAILAIVAGVLL